MNVKNDLIFAGAEILFGASLAITNSRNQDASRSLEINLFALAVIGDGTRRLYQIVRDQMNHAPVIQNLSYKHYFPYFSSREGVGLVLFNEMEDPNDQEEVALNDVYWIARRITTQNVKLLEAHQENEEEPTVVSRICSSFRKWCGLKKEVRLEPKAFLKKFADEEESERIKEVSEQEIFVPEFDFKTKLVRRSRKVSFED